MKRFSIRAFSIATRCPLDRYVRIRFDRPPSRAGFSAFRSVQEPAFVDDICLDLGAIAHAAITRVSVSGHLPPIFAFGLVFLHWSAFRIPCSTTSCDTTHNDLTIRCSQPLHGVRLHFQMSKTRSFQTTLGAISGG